MTADERLARIRVKIDRAKKHLSDLDIEIRAFLDSEPYVTGTKPDPKTPNAIKYYIVSVKETPLLIPAIAGDVIQNLRSALDHLACHLVSAARRKPSRATSFPIIDTNKPSVYKTARHGKVKGMSKAAKKAIDACKPYQGGNDALWRLHQLNNIDKHRVLITAGLHVTSVIPSPLIRVGILRAFAAQEGLPVTASDAQLEAIAISMSLSGGNCPLKAGDDLPLPFVSLPDIPELKKDMHFTFDVAFNELGIIERESLGKTLQDMTDLVDNLILSFKPLLA